MKLREAINNIPDDDWLKITEQSTEQYRNYIGKAPKKYITGEILDYEVLFLSPKQRMQDYNMYSFIVKNKSVNS